MKDKAKRYLVLAVGAGIIILLDQFTKYLVRTNLPVNGVWAPWDWLLPYARLFHTQNTGVAFGMLQGANLILAVLAGLVSLAILYYYPRVPARDWALQIALILQLAGALGNLIDRVIFGYVTDFISVGTFAVFNIADSSITVGVIILLIGVWLDEQKKSRQAAKKSEDRASQEAKE